MEFNELTPKYQKGDLIGWTCSRCGWSCQRDVDPQTAREYATEDEAEDAFHGFGLADFAEECRAKLQPGEHLVSVSKVMSQCDELGNTSEIMRDDWKL
jgi:hypothetical protein